MRQGLFFRVDASRAGGLGHLRRCSVLAGACMDAGVGASYFLRQPEGEILPDLIPEGAEVTRVPWHLDETAQCVWLAAECRRRGCHAGVLDYYGQTEAGQLVLRDAGLRWMQFGNTGHDHPLLGELVHDAAPGVTVTDYSNRIRFPETRCLLGPSYALLRPEFARLAETESPVRAQDGSAARVLVTMGGGDDRGATVAVLDWLLQAGFAGAVEVLATSLNPSIAVIRTRLEAMPQRMRLHEDLWTPETVMAGCDLAVCAGGTTLHELACLGVPALVLVLAENQVASARAWRLAGYGDELGSWPGEGASPTMALPCLRRWLADGALRSQSARRCRETQDGLGAGRVVEQLLDLTSSKE